MGSSPSTPTMKEYIKPDTKTYAMEHRPPFSGCSGYHHRPPKPPWHWHNNSIEDNEEEIWD